MSKDGDLGGGITYPDRHFTRVVFTFLGNELLSFSDETLPKIIPRKKEFKIVGGDRYFVSCVIHHETTQEDNIQYKDRDTPYSKWYFTKIEIILKKLP